MFIATLIAAEMLSESDISAAIAILDRAGSEPEGWSWLDPGKAADIRFAAQLGAAQAALTDFRNNLDIITQSIENRRKKLFVADMDSTIITVECLDELADYAGIKAQVAAITERAMRGEIDFIGALDERVALLKGLPAATLGRCHDERVRLSPGAAQLVRTMRAHGTYCVLVSGGFTEFADRVAAEAGFDQAVANQLEIADDCLTGVVRRPIVDAAVKAQLLLETAENLGLGMEETLAIGDGANDLGMIEMAGLGIAYHGKPALREAADARIDHTDLTALLYAQGYPRDSWVAV
jgi:phosphoserine phosphatase